MSVAEELRTWQAQQRHQARAAQRHVLDLANHFPLFRHRILLRSTHVTLLSKSDAIGQMGENAFAGRRNPVQMAKLLTRLVRRVAGLVQQCKVKERAFHYNGGLHFHFAALS